ncbi:MAG: ThiF family adenylyltransferase [Lachnospiraceae bacterium]|nr:ThiF family adenylyltransferase [Lachnospiraceae bacterium]MDD3616812.1 ThiF family adenylyltransferase [Lachnospiraceae bacterium]
MKFATQELDFLIKEKKKTVFISEKQQKNTAPRVLYGRYFDRTGIYNIFPEEIKEEGEVLGEVLSVNAKPVKEGFCAVVTEEGLAFFCDGQPITYEAYSLYQSIFSRNKGILETNVMAEKKVVLLGCGSVGSLAAMELARCGVGSFLLIDPDILEYHNLCRHQCGIEDVGNLKVDALSRKLKCINPAVKVVTFDGILQNIPKDMLDKFCVEGATLFIGCADNRAADVYANRISIYYQAAFLSIGFWERAYAGEIFYHIPGKGMPCYSCALGDGGNISERAQASHHVYSNQEDTEGLKFEPGISADINYITTIGIKLAIDILNASNQEYIPRLLRDLKQYTIICNTSNPQIGGEMVEIFSYPLQVSTSLVVGFNDKCKNACRLEEGELHGNHIGAGNI